MAIPTYDEFQQFIKLMSNTDRPAISMKADQIVTEFVKSGVPDMAAIADFVRADEEARDAEWKGAWESPVGKWLNGQDAYQRALRAVYVRKKRPSGWSRESAFEQLLAQRVERIRACFEMPSRDAYYARCRRWLPSLTDDDLAAKYEWRASRKGVAQELLGRLQPITNIGMHARIVKALRKYHYSSARDIQKYKALPTVLDRAVSAFREFEDAAEMLLENHDLLQVDGVRVVVGAGMIQRIRQKRLDIEENKAMILSALPPIRRNDGTARERLLVMEIGRIFKRYSTSHKTGAIAELMRLEGIQTPLDARTIERIICKSKHITDTSMAALRA